MLSYISQTMAHNEKLVGTIDLHWLTLIKPVATGTLMLLAYMASLLWLGFNSIGLLVALVVFAYFVVWPIILNVSTEMGVTNKRIILKEGFLSVNSEEMRISSIETVEVRQSIIERIFNVGSIKITGKGVSDLTLSYIKNPLNAKLLIENVLPVPQEIEQD